MTGLQIPSMAYPPSSAVSYFNKILFISYQNDWLNGDGAFFVIRCINLTSNKTKKQRHGVFFFFKHYTGIVLRAIYSGSCIQFAR